MLRRIRIELTLYRQKGLLTYRWTLTHRMCFCVTSVENFVVGSRKRNTHQQSYLLLFSRSRCRNFDHHPGYLLKGRIDVHEGSPSIPRFFQICGLGCLTVSAFLFDAILFGKLARVLFLLLYHRSFLVRRSLPNDTRGTIRSF